MVPNTGDCNFQFLPTGMDPMDPILDPTECRFINILLMISFSHNQILWLSSFLNSRTFDKMVLQRSNCLIYINSNASNIDSYLCSLLQ
jgi:hypothetical protein